VKKYILEEYELYEGPCAFKITVLCGSVSIERSSLKGEAQRFKKNPTSPHHVRDL
jgi:hypothetical protein